MLVIEQAPENVWDDNNQRKDEALHVKMRRGGNQCRRGDNPGLCEATRQEVNERVLQGTAQDDLLQHTED